jgi:hypothetical protein
MDYISESESLRRCNYCNVRRSPSFYSIKRTTGQLKRTCNRCLQRLKDKYRANHCDHSKRIEDCIVCSPLEKVEKRISPNIPKSTDFIELLI